MRQSVLVPRHGFEPIVQQSHRERIAAYLASYGVRPPADMLTVLEQCDSGAELWFALGFTSLPACHAEPPARFVAYRCSLTLQEPCGAYRIDAVLRIPMSRAPIAVEIDGEAWHSAPAARERDRARQAVLDQAGYRVIRIPALQARHTGRRLWWSLAQDLARDVPSITTAPTLARTEAA